MTTAKPVVAKTDSPDWPDHHYTQQSQVRLPISWDRYVGRGITDIEQPWEYITVTDEGPNHIRVGVPGETSESIPKMVWFWIDKARIAQLAKILEVWS